MNHVPGADLWAEASAEAEGAGSGTEDWGSRNGSGSVLNAVWHPPQQK